MKKVIQNKDRLISTLSRLETDWKDDFAINVIEFLEQIDNQTFKEEIIPELLDRDFDTASTVFRLFLEKSKDEYTSILKEMVEKPGMSGKSGYRKHRNEYLEILKKLSIDDIIRETIERKYTWKDIITERLKAGRGSAIKGQRRGRELEDFVEECIEKVFSSYDARCSFIGQKGSSTEKADFAIPSKENPEIIIEVKGYGATGSKQTDVIGDIHKIIQEKRHDSTFLLFTDGITWKERESDFKKLIKFQNEGYIYKIYTKQMKEEFENDLRLLKNEKAL